MSGKTGTPAPSPTESWKVMVFDAPAGTTAMSPTRPIRRVHRSARIGNQARHGGAPRQAALHSRASWHRSSPASRGSSSASPTSGRSPGRSPSGSPTKAPSSRSPTRASGSRRTCASSPRASRARSSPPATCARTTTSRASSPRSAEAFGGEPRPARPLRRVRRRGGSRGALHGHAARPLLARARRQRVLARRVRAGGRAADGGRAAAARS